MSEEDSKILNLELNAFEAIMIAHRYGGCDGAHHQRWVIDQMVRKLVGSEEEYKKWVEEYEEDGDYEWDVGIAP